MTACRWLARPHTSNRSRGGVQGYAARFPALLHPWIAAKRRPVPLLGSVNGWQPEAQTGGGEGKSGLDSDRGLIRHSIFYQNTSPPLVAMEGAPVSADTINIAGGNFMRPKQFRFGSGFLSPDKCSARTIPLPGSPAKLLREASHAPRDLWMCFYLISG